ncbi:unnamed protein product [Bemisia tabaci]|uniref:Uncharacterized protein n=1 Tax=Bemisia tabaci TaxID=7038 RepID=A0A9P0ACG8_BEMTA|nr:unnamed protein product [Bemisia tabaci]
MASGGETALRRSLLRAVKHRRNGSAMGPLRKRHCFIFLCSLAIVTIYHVQKEIFRPRLERLVYYEGTESPEESVTCRFPILHPFEKSILHLISVAPPVRCPQRNLVLTQIDRDGRLGFNRTALQLLGYDEDASSLDCYYQEISRAPEDDFNVIYGEKVPLTDTHIPTEDFIYVECDHRLTRIPVYRNFHAYARRHPSVRRFKDDLELGVSVIGIDSMSRLNFMRQLSESYRLLTERMNATVMLGFNKVGENTWPNVMAMLTGRESPPYPHNSYQGWPFIWNEFREAGAATIYAEDLPEFNMFDYLASGIKEQPTLHYMRTFWLAVEASFLYKTSATYCLGPTPKHIIFFDYLLSFLRAYKDSPVFMFSLFNELSHDYVNTVGALDGDLTALLRTGLEEGLFNRSVVIVLGDHGNRIDPIRVTFVGRIEDRMPMVSVVVPEWFPRVYPEWKTRLARNRKRFTASHDLFATFRDVLATLTHDPNTLNRNERTPAENQEFLSLRHLLGPLRTEAPHLFDFFTQDTHGISLFQTIPEDRDCPAAGVPPIFCTCEENKKDVDVDDAQCHDAAQKVVDHFNSVVLRNLTTLCARQTLKQVIFCRRSPSLAMDLTIATEPGGGIFEATTSRQGLGPDIPRINTYGSQANCLPRATLAAAPILKGVCYCV